MFLHKENNNNNKLSPSSRSTLAVIQYMGRLSLTEKRWLGENGGGGQEAHPAQEDPAQEEAQEAGRVEGCRLQVST